MWYLRMNRYRSASTTSYTGTRCRERSIFNACIWQTMWERVICCSFSRIHYVSNSKATCSYRVRYWMLTEQPLKSFCAQKYNSNLKVKIECIASHLVILRLDLINILSKTRLWRSAWDFAISVMRYIRQAQNI